MAWLTVAGTDIPIEYPDGSSRSTVLIGQRERAVSGQMRSSVVAEKGEWSFKTGHLTTTQKNNLKSSLEGTPPLSCSGDALGGTVSCYPKDYRERPVTPLGDRWRVEFTLMEE